MQLFALLTDGLSNKSAKVKYNKTEGKVNSKFIDYSININRTKNKQK